MQRHAMRCAHSNRSRRGAHRRIARRAGARRGPAHAHGHLRRLLVHDRRQADVPVVGRVPLLPAAQPRPVARHLPEDEGGGLQRHLALLRLGLPLAGAGRLRLHRRARRRPAARHGPGGRPLRDRPPGPVHQRRGRLRRLPRLADHAGRAAPAPTTRDTWRTRRVADAGSTAIIARHQLTNGTRHGDRSTRSRTSTTTAARRRAYMEHLEDKAARRRHHRAA